MAYANDWLMDVELEFAISFAPEVLGFLNETMTQLRLQYSTPYMKPLNRISSFRHPPPITPFFSSRGSEKNVRRCINWQWFVFQQILFERHH